MVMDLQVLVSTMNQKDHRILEKMNIQSDAIIINQCDKINIEKFTYKGNTINFISLPERGVGLSRNTALMRATADICLFADDDVKYVNGYRDIICEAFKNNHNADIIIFNVPSTNEKRGQYFIKENKKLSFFNCFKFGTYQIAVRLSSIRKANVHFSLLFGGGAKYSAGEDSLFLAESLKKGLKIYSCSKTIGVVDHQESTWFKGYTDKFFIDKGVFYAALSHRLARIFCLRYAIKHKNMYIEDKSCYEAYKLMIEGVKQWKRSC